MNKSFILGCVSDDYGETPLQESTCHCLDGPEQEFVLRQLGAQGQCTPGILNHLCLQQNF